MSIVIPFAPRPRTASSSQSAAKPHEGGEILFFTGVRYERQVEPAPAQAQGRRRRRSVPVVAQGASIRQPV